MVTPEQISLPDTGGVADLAERDKKQEKLSRNNSKKKRAKDKEGRSTIFLVSQTICISCEVHNSQPGCL